MNSLPRIIAFTKDWDDVPTSTTHVLREMSRTMPVLWVSSIGTRKPRFGHPSHAGRIMRRLVKGFRRAERKENKLKVLHPLLIPKAQSAVSRWLNRHLFAWQVGRELKDMGDGPIEYWCFVPNAVDLLPGVRKSVEPVDKLGSPQIRPPWLARNGPNPTCGGRGCAEPQGTRGSFERLVRHLIVYYCVDDWSKFRYLDREWIARKEAELLSRADVVFAVSRYLEEKLRKTAGERTVYLSHGVEYRKFKAALDTTGLPREVVDLPEPVIGFYGNIYPWVDLELVGGLARQRPEWSFVMIGGVFCDVAGFETVPNVHFLGRREHDDLPRYCAAFDAAIIPYDMRNPRMQSVNPVKTRELLAAGVPIVASDVPELRQFGDEVLIAETAEDWIEAIERQVARSDHAEVSATVAGDDWSTRVGEIRSVVDLASTGLAGGEGGTFLSPQRINEPNE